MDRLKLRERRKILNLTLQEVADKLKLTKATVQKYESGYIKDIDTKRLEELAKVLQCSPAYLMGWENKQDAEPKIPTTPSNITHNLTYEETELIKKYNNLDEYGKRMVDVTIAEQQYRIEEQRKEKEKVIATPKTVTYHIPYYDMPVSAGTGQYLDYTNCSVITLKEKPPASADFVLSVSGDSMEPTFYDGDKVFVEETNTLNLGDIGIFYYDGDVFIKEYGEKGLISHNEKYKLIQGDERMRVLGKVLGTVEE